jgi:hypothetical protein
MYAREGVPHIQDDSSYDEVDARTVQWLQAELSKRSKAKRSASEQADEPSGVHPELIR